MHKTLYYKRFYTLIILECGNPTKPRIFYPTHVVYAVPGRAIETSKKIKVFESF